MTVNVQAAKEWTKHNGGKDDPKFNSCSPNLEAISFELHTQWPAHGDFYGVHQLGCYGERDVRGGELPSPHSHGAATDERYTDGLRFTHFDLNRALCLNAIIPWLITNSAELKIGAIHDYVASRIWHAGRTANVADAYTLWWKQQKPSASTGMGQKWAGWLHIETTEAGWHDATPISKRPLTFQPTNPVPNPPNPQPPNPEDDMAMILYRDPRFNNVFRVGDSAITISGTVFDADRKAGVPYFEKEAHDQSLITYMRSSHLTVLQLVANNGTPELSQAAIDFIASLGTVAPDLVG